CYCLGLVPLCLASRCSLSYCYGDHRDLHSFPTRRSSDLARRRARRPRHRDGGLSRCGGEDLRHRLARGPCRKALPGASRGRRRRSEEHTSELQSRENLVCRLLLEKKKKKNK